MWNCPCLRKRSTDTDPVLTPYSVRNTLLDPALEEGWGHTLSEWEEAANTQIQATTAYVRGLRNQILNVTDGIESMDELEHILALCYMDLKCQWAILNMQIQYAVVYKDEIREDLMYRATCVTQILDAVQDLLAPADVDAMEDLISQPIGRTAQMASMAPAPPPPSAPPAPAPVPMPEPSMSAAPASGAFVSRPQPPSAPPVQPMGPPQSPRPTAEPAPPASIFPQGSR